MPLHTAWKQSLPSSETMNCPPVLAGNVLAAATQDAAGHDYLTAFSKYDGSIRWKHKSSTRITELVSSNGTLFFLGHSTDFFKDPLGQRLSGDAADTPEGCDIDPHLDDTAVTFTGLLALDVGSGRLKSHWYDVAKRRDVKHFTIDEDVLLITTAGNQIAAYDLHSGKMLWEHLFPGVAEILPPPAHGHGACFVNTGTSIEALNTRSGETRWRFEKPTLRRDITPLVGNGLVIVMDKTQTHALDVESGTPRWSMDCDDTWNAPAASWEANCLVFTKSLEVLLVDLDNGKWVLREALQGAGAAQFLPPVIDQQADSMRMRGTTPYKGSFVTATDTGLVMLWELHVDHLDPTGVNERKLKLTFVPPEQFSPLKPFTPVIGDGFILLCHEDNTLTALHKAEENLAPRFVNQNAFGRPGKALQEPNYIRTNASAAYAFGRKDFSMECWAKTTQGGEVLTQSPHGTSGAGFRLSIVNSAGGIRCGDFGEGRVLFVVSDPKTQIMLVASSDPSRLTDGVWHHLCVVRQENKIAIFIDGVSHPTEVVMHRELFPKHVQDVHPANELFLSQKLVDVTSQVPPVGNAQEPIVIGGYAPSNEGFNDDHALNFDGLIADVRIWNSALSPAEINDNNPRRLSGKEAGLTGYWPLMDGARRDAQHVFKDLVSGLPSQVIGVEQRQTTLQIQESLRPYLSTFHPEQSGTNWPYKRRWQLEVDTPPLLNSREAFTLMGEKMAFVSGGSLHVMDSVHGKRLWAKPVADDLVSVLSDHDGIYVVGKDYILSLDPETGATQKDFEFGFEIEDAALAGPYLGLVIVSTRTGKRGFYSIDKQTAARVSYMILDHELLSTLHVGEAGMYFADKESLHLLHHPLRDQEGKLKHSAVHYKFQHAMNVAAGDKYPMRITSAGGIVFLSNGKSIYRLNGQTLSPDGIWHPDFLGRLGASRIKDMVASPAHNRLVFTSIPSTQGGAPKVHFLEFVSGKEAAVHSMPSNSSLSRPVIEGDSVFLTYHHAKADGTPEFGRGGHLQVWDVETATDRASQSFPRLGIWGDPVMCNGTMYFRCQTGPQTQAIHSLVLGKDYALKLDHLARKELWSHEDIVMEDTRGVLDRDPPGADGHHGVASGNFTLETWVKVPPPADKYGSRVHGGDLLSSPGLKRKNGDGGFSLKVNHQGEVVAVFSTHDHRHESITAGAGLGDGAWHHVAAVFRKDKGAASPTCELFINGRRHDDVTARTGPNPMHLATTNRLVTIGGPCKHSFEGMMADVRIWGTWLQPEQIASRRSIRLRGDEPDLLVNWSFDHGAVHDYSLNDFHLQSAKGVDVWLTDLHFDAPRYPYLTTHSEANGQPKKQVAPNGHGQTIVEAAYTTTITARKGDGSGRPLTPITITTNEEVQVSGPNIERVLLKPGMTKSFVSDKQGNLKLRLLCNNIKHSPELNVRAGFMRTNRWLRVSPAIQNQKLRVVPPPTLKAHSSMIEDLHYSPGDTLGKHQPGGGPTFHDGAQITTINTTIIATRSDGSPMPSQLIEVWAESHLKIEVDGETHAINAHNSARFKTGADGEVVITLHEDAHAGGLLDVPNLKVRAGFMPLNSRFVIHPAEHSIQALSKVTAKQLTGEEALPHAENKKTSLLQGDNKKHAKAIADTLQHMMALTKKTKHHAPHAAGMATARPLTSEAVNLHPGLDSADSVQSLHHHDHHDVHHPVSPDHAPAPHFVLHLDKDGEMEYQALHNDDDLNQHLSMHGMGDADTLFASASALGPDDAAGWGFSSLTHSISHAYHKVKRRVAHVYHKARKIVVRVVKKVHAITKKVIHVVEVVAIKIGEAAKAAAKWVIKTVGDVVNHVVGFLASIGSKLKDLYNFLKSAFEWKQILEVHNVLKDVLQGGLKKIEGGLKAEVPNAVVNLANGLKAKVDKVLGLEHAHKSLNGVGSTPNAQSSTVVSHSKSTKGKHMQNKFKHHSKKSGGVPKRGAPNITPPPEHPDLMDRAKKIGEDLMQVFSSFGSPSDMSLDPFKHLLGDLVDFVIEVVETMALAALKVIDSLFKFVIDGLTHEIHIPFISSLYETLTGNKLSLLDVGCLMLAVPVNLVMTMAGFDWKKEKEGVQNGVRAKFAGVGGRKRNANAAGANWGKGIAIFFSIVWAVCSIAWVSIKMTNEYFAGLASQAPAEAKPWLDLTGCIEFILGTAAFIAQSLYRGAQNNQFDLFGDILSFDNGAGLTALIAAIVVACGSGAAYFFDKTPHKLFGPVMQVVGAVIAVVALICLLADVVIALFRGGVGVADVGEWLMSTIVGIQGAMGFLALDVLNAASMASQQAAAAATGIASAAAVAAEPIPAIVLTGIDGYGMAALVVLHYSMGYGGKLIWH